MLTPVIAARLNGVATVVSVSPLLFAGAAVFALVTVLISCHRPGRLAGKVSPVEAVRYTEGKALKRTGKRSGKGVPLLSMAWANLGRSRGKTFVTILSLSLAVVLLTMTITFAGGLEMDKYTANFTASDFILANAGQFQTGGDTFNDEMAIPREVINAIDAQGGITDGGCIYGKTAPAEEFVTEGYYRSVWSQWNTPEQLDEAFHYMDRTPEVLLADRVQLYGMDPFALDHLTVIEGDLTKLSDPGGKAAGGDAGEDGIEEVHHTHQAHNEAQGPVQQEEHAPEALKLSGVRDLALIIKLGILGACVISQKGFHGGIGLVGGVKGVIHDAVRTGVPDKGLTAQNELVNTVVAVGEGVGHRRQGGYRVVHIPVFDRPLGISGTFGHIFQRTVNFTGSRIVVLVLLHIADGHRVPQPGPVTVHLCFSVVVVTVHSGNVVPLAVLQSIGMTGRQLRTMLALEGLFYTVGAALLAPTLIVITAPFVGPALNGLICFFTYHFTIWPIAVVLPLFGVLGILIPVLSCRSAQRYSVVERLRQE